ncbi:MAG: META domain-containing protein [Pseudomonadota bacterium]
MAGALGIALGYLAGSSLIAHAAGDADFQDSRWKVTQLGTEDVGMAGDLHFDKDRMSGASACNFFGAQYSFAGESGLTIKIDRMTRKGCSGEALRLEKGYIEALEKVRSYTFADTDHTVLDLKGEDGEVVARLAKQAQFTLEGTHLKVVSYLFDGGLYNVNPGSKPTVRFTDGKIIGDTGCTRFEGTYELTETTVKIKLNRPFSKVAKCPEDDIQQDRMVLENLELTNRFDNGRNLIRLLHPEKEWAVLWLALDLNPSKKTSEAFVPKEN